MIRLSNAEFRLVRWDKVDCDGECDMEPAVRRQSINGAISTLEQLHSLLERGREKSCHYGNRGAGAGGGTEGKLLTPTAGKDLQVQDLFEMTKKLGGDHKKKFERDEAQYASNCDHGGTQEDVKRASLRERFARKLSIKPKDTDIWRGIKWALVGEHIFDKLVADTAALMADLESLCPAAKTVMFEFGAEIEGKIRGLLAEKDGYWWKRLMILRRLLLCRTLLHRRSTIRPTSGTARTLAVTNASLEERTSL
ncbi:hypothetical protein LTR48_006998 [Friedmanniomyces endolithicus]|uniref:Prion-inhibition and propagation HeLo domain-containing protein n=1 Tax=Rachicladosporium monterosium TaxID=1507873 RepID=A0ABR0LB14_9PEZI|nr:hypothetical protein LTR48_006998 [Friedmanniomyces endolithicus]KAK5146214.1 hypothetical protein LTR32_002153 [Rachicladosporium monterosium]